MTALWLVIAAVAVSSAILKGAGPALIGGRDLPARTQAVITLLAPALLAALVLVETVGTTTGPALDARAAGVSAAAISQCLRAPLLVVVGAATAATALARLLGA